MAPAFDCNTPPRVQFHDPLVLAREYIRRDTLGMMLEPDERLLDLVSCDVHISGSEYKVIASLRRLVPAKRGADTATFRVIYHVVGEIVEGHTGMIFDAKTRTDTTEIVAVRSSYGWRVANYDVPYIAPAQYLRAMKGVWRIKNPEDLETAASQSKSEHVPISTRPPNER